MKQKWPTGFGNRGKVFTFTPKQLWSEQEVAETGWPYLRFHAFNESKPIKVGTMVRLVECKRMSVTKVLTPEQQLQRKAGMHVELPRNVKHYLVVRMDTNTMVPYDAKFKLREDPYSGR